jgi:hypothetical protein
MVDIWPCDSCLSVFLCMYEYCILYIPSFIVELPQFIWQIFHNFRYFKKSRCKLILPFCFTFESVCQSWGKVSEKWLPQDSMTADSFTISAQLIENYKIPLKVVGIEKWEGSGVWLLFRIVHRTVVIDVCLLFNGPVVFSATYFRFLLLKLN